jgi:hypothetical protein
VTRELSGGWLVPTLPPPGTCACNHRAPGRRWQADPARRAACGPSTGSGAAAELFQHAETATRSNEAHVGTRGLRLARDAPAATCLRRKKACLPGITSRRLKITADMIGTLAVSTKLQLCRELVDLCALLRSRRMPDRRDGRSPAAAGREQSARQTRRTVPVGRRAPRGMRAPRREPAAVLAAAMVHRPDACFAGRRQLA